MEKPKIYNLSDIPLAAASRDEAVEAKRCINAVIQEFNITASDFIQMYGFLNQNKEVVLSAISDIKSGKNVGSIAMKIVPKLFKKK